MVDAWYCGLSSLSLDCAGAVFDTRKGRRLVFFAMIFLLLVIGLLDCGMIEGWD